MNKIVFQLGVKRFLDILISLIGLLIFSPFFLVVAILIRIYIGSPIFFTQDRVGKNNKVFKIIKFRTMKDSVDKNGEILPDEYRITKLGSVLRSISIDEIPELINVLKGDMSLVGPRPLLVQYLPLYSSEQARRHEVLPGVTGWAQVNGRNAISWGEKFRLDVEYIDNFSIKFDIKILFLTFYKVLVREGINKEGQVTTEYFTGNN